MQRVEIMQYPVQLQYLFTGGQLQHDRSIFSKQGVDCFCNVVQGEGHRLEGNIEIYTVLVVSWRGFEGQKTHSYQTYILQCVGSHILWE